MLLEKYFFSDHSIEQYIDRAKLKKKDRNEAIKAMKRDLRIMNIKKIVRVNKEVHVFTHGHKEFIFVRKGKNLLLQTFIKRNKEDTLYIVKKREYARKKHERLEKLAKK